MFPMCEKGKKYQIKKSKKSINSNNPKKNSLNSKKQKKNHDWIVPTNKKHVIKEKLYEWLLLAIIKIFINQPHNFMFQKNNKKIKKK